ncbi:hypothetical protein CYMTET_9130 [Cymbomonas tetramitiformis]|uniref:Uncharacterized protein n=1 Tax=Cymbomonas tetramitiformis TaxID=36881 RepID=A0AAE0GSC4_9CHLO|nr:hypothetical protein CYMTET_9130 [Cymbomonas tetramitiformis]
MAEGEGDAPPEKAVALKNCESIFLTGTTVKIVGLDDMGDNLLMKVIEKETILKDIQFRGAISDFHCIKAKITKSDYDQLLIRYNKDDIYGDGNNYELCLLKASADAWQKELADKEAAIAAAAATAAAAAEAEAEAKSTKKKKKRKPAAEWVSQGSELEIEEAMAKPTRELLVVSIARKRREFGASHKFSDKDSQELWNSSQMECRPFKDPNFELKRLEHELGIQAIASKVLVSVQATNNMPQNGTTQYEPLAMSEEEAGTHIHGENMDGFLGGITDRYELALQQNEVMDIFEDEFASLAEEDNAPGTKSANVISEYQSFTDLTYSKGKKVSAIAWMPKRKGVVGVACTEPVTFDERIESAGRVKTSAILIWNFVDPIHPQYVLEAPFDVFAFDFNPKKPEIVAGGCYNGQIILWNTTSVQAQMRKKEKKTDVDETGEAAIPVVKHHLLSAIESSHTLPVTDIIWLPEGIEVMHKTGKVVETGGSSCNMFVTLAADGKVLFWDLRAKKDPKRGEIIWTPTYSVTLTRLDIAGDLSAVKFSFSTISGLKSTFFGTSMDGEVVYADFLRPDDVDHPEFTKSVSSAHFGPVLALQRSPFFEDIILSIGDWSFKIYKEGIATPIFSSHCSDTYLNTGCWSPTRPGVIYTAKMDGVMEVWDLLDRSHEASMSATVSSYPIAALAFWPHKQAQQLLAVGDSQGVLHILELPRNLRRPVQNEEKIMEKFFDRELSRVKYVEERQKIRAAELKEKEQAAQAALVAAGASGAAPAKEDKKNSDDKYDEKMEQEYRTLEREFKIQLGLIDENEPMS